MAKRRYPDKDAGFEELLEWVNDFDITEETDVNLILEALASGKVDGRHLARAILWDRMDAGTSCDFTPCPDADQKEQFRTYWENYPNVGACRKCGMLLDEGRNICGSCAGGRPLSPGYLNMPE